MYGSIAISHKSIFYYFSKHFQFSKIFQKVKKLLLRKKHFCNTKFPMLKVTVESCKALQLCSHIWSYVFTNTFALQCYQIPIFCFSYYYFPYYFSCFSYTIYRLGFLLKIESSSSVQKKKKTNLEKLILKMQELHSICFFKIHYL